MRLDSSRDARAERAPANPPRRLVSGVGSVLDGLAPGIRPVVLPGPRVRDKLVAGVPLLHGEEVYVDGGAVRETWDRLLDALAETADDAADREADLAAVRAALAEHRLHAEHATVEALASHPEHVHEIARVAGAPADLVLRLADLAARPILAQYARQLAPALGLAAWDRGYCPICGAWPVRAERPMAGGEVRLRCGRCITAWPASARTCQHGPPLVEAAVERPTFSALLGHADVPLAGGRASGSPRDTALSEAGFRLELADGEGEWDGFDDD